MKKYETQTLINVKLIDVSEVVTEEGKKGWFLVYTREHNYLGKPSNMELIFQREIKSIKWPKGVAL